MQKESLQFAFEVNSKKMEDREHSLKFGHTLLHNGMSYHVKLFIISIKHVTPPLQVVGVLISIFFENIKW